MAQNLKIANWLALINKQTKTVKMVLFFFVFLLFIIPFTIVMSYSSDAGIKDERQRLDKIIEKVELAIKQKSYDEAEFLANQLNWEFDSDYESVSEYKKSWDKKREGILYFIANQKGETRTVKEKDLPQKIRDYIDL